MSQEVRDKFFDFFELPEDLTLEKISKRATDFRESEDGKIKFDMVRHLSLLGRSTRTDSPARWHVWSTYIFDPVSGDWENKVDEVEFHYDPVLLVEEEFVYLKKTGILQKVARKDKGVEEKVDELLEIVREYYDNLPEAYEISDDDWNEMIEDLVKGLKPKLENEIKSFSND